MVDLEEPGRIEYTEHEQMHLNDHFALLVHTLLLSYLALHNFLIPVISNILRGQNLLLDIHFWFLLHIPLQLMLRKKKLVPSWYFQFLVVGSLARLIFEVYFAATLKSWSILSVLVSELSSIIFFFLYHPNLSSKRFSFLSLLSIPVVLCLSVSELRSSSSFSFQSQPKVILESKNLGCKGSVTQLRYPIKQDSALTHALSLTSCGFSTDSIVTDSTLHILNKSPHPLNLRLYRLQVLHGRVKWRFMRLIQVPVGSTWDVSSYLSSDAAYLIKSPERRKMGHLVIRPLRQTEFPLGAGSLNLTFDTLNWSPL